MKTPKDIIHELSEQVRDQIDKILPDENFVDQFQDNFRRATRRFDAPGPEMRRTESFEINGVSVHYFEPFGRADDMGPTLIYAHGGGFVTCDTDTHAGIIRRLANGSLCRIVSVDYRLAPQYPFPAAYDDMRVVLDWALRGAGRDRGIDPSMIAIGGDSAGGNLAARIAQDYRTDIAAQILLYPLMQLKDVKPADPGPQDWLQIGTVALKYIQEHYVAGADVMDPRLSPLFEENLSALPPAYVLTCGLDPLRFEGRLYAEKVSRAGNDVVHVYEKTMPHGFLNFAKAFPRAGTLPLEAGEFLRDRFNAARAEKETTT